MVVEQVVDTSLTTRAETWVAYLYHQFNLSVASVAKILSDRGRKVHKLSGLRCELGIGAYVKVMLIQLIVIKVVIGCEVHDGCRTRWERFNREAYDWN